VLAIWPIRCLTLDMADLFSNSPERYWTHSRSSSLGYADGLIGLLGLLHLGAGGHCTRSVMYLARCVALDNRRCYADHCFDCSILVSLMNGAISASGNAVLGQALSIS